MLMIFDENMFHKSGEYPAPRSCVLFRPGIHTWELQGENKLNFYMYEFVQIYFYIFLFIVTYIIIYIKI